MVETMRSSPGPAGSPRPNNLIAELSSAERIRLEPYFEPVDLEYRQVLAKTDTMIKHVHFLQDAITSTVAELSGGEVVEVGLMGAEGVAGHGLLFGPMPSTTTVIVQVPGRATRMWAADFQREVVEADSEFFRSLLRYANAFMGMVAQIAACNASHTVEQRFARWLLLVHDRLGRDAFPLTHEFAALLLGVRRAGVTEVASRLRTAGAIDYRAGEMQIRDRTLLSSVSCDCYEAITRLMELPFVKS
jgi:CRP-like cAMP-binding protein